MVGNGATVHALVRGSAIAAQGHAVRLVTAGEVLPHTGLEVRTRRLPTSLAQAVAGARGFLRDIHEFRPDLLHIHYAGGRLGTLGAAAGVHPLVVTVMGGDVQPEQHLSGHARLERRATRRLLEQADLLLAKSEALRGDIQRFGDFAHKTETVRWGIDTERFRHEPARAAAWRAAHGFLPDDRLVLSPRLLRPLYNTHLLLQALPELVRRVPRALLLICEHRSHPAYKQQLLTLARSLGCEAQLRWLGAVPYEEMPALLSACDVSVGVPFSDGLPQSLFEALASETPAVIGRLPAYAEVVTEGEHVLLAELEPVPIAAALTRALLDQPLRARLAQAGLERVRAVANLPHEACRVSGFYARLLTEPRRHTRLSRRLADLATLPFRL